MGCVVHRGEGPRVTGASSSNDATWTQTEPQNLGNSHLIHWPREGCMGTGWKPFPSEVGGPGNPPPAPQLPRGASPALRHPDSSEVSGSRNEGGADSSSPAPSGDSRVLAF